MTVSCGFVGNCSLTIEDSLLNQFGGFITSGVCRGPFPTTISASRMIQTQEIRMPGVAGLFLHGAQWSIGPEEWSSFASDVDMRTWFIETLAKSGLERDVPHIQSPEFYAHE